MQSFIARLEQSFPLTLEAKRALLASGGSPQVLLRGRELTSSCASAAGTWLFLSGLACRSVHLEGRRRILGCLVTGDVLNLGPLTEGEIPHSIVVLHNVQALHLRDAHRAELMERFPCIAKAMWRDALAEANTSRDWLLNVGHRNAMGRAAHLFCELYVKLQNSESASGNSCRIPLTQVDLSDALALSPVHMNRVLREMQRDGVCTFRHQRLIIHDFRRLLNLGGLTSRGMEGLGIKPTLEQARGRHFEHRPGSTA